MAPDTACAFHYVTPLASCPSCQAAQARDKIMEAIGE